MDGWQLVLYLHLLAMAFFVGGQLVLAAVVVPVERRASDPERMRAAGRRFGVGSAVALVILLATGIAMADHFSLWSSDTLRIKLTLVGVLIALTLLHSRFPRVHALQAVTLLVSLVVVWLGADLAV